jgi:hypothetical protein
LKPDELAVGGSVISTERWNGGAGSRTDPSLSSNWAVNSLPGRLKWFSSVSAA